MKWQDAVMLEWLVGVRSSDQQGKFLSIKPQ